MAETRTDETKGDADTGTDESGANDRLARAWERVQTLPAYRKVAVAEYIEFLASRDDDDDIWEPDEEDEAALQAWLSGEGDDSVPWEEVKRKSRELGDRVLD